MFRDISPLWWPVKIAKALRKFTIDITINMFFDLEIDLNSFAIGNAINCYPLILTRDFLSINILYACYSKPT
jgi:hypothetical protein